ncbi:hypothetical protein ILYODFUR_036256 [Ilyodon furcidens]|uniref:Uncharacterized protein n=1 Tax=Ilyodon furcidens TaxID=33524 RepID=A0ABV0TDZ2_9TELE
MRNGVWVTSPPTQLVLQYSFTWGDVPPKAHLWEQLVEDQPEVQAGTEGFRCVAWSWQKTLLSIFSEASSTSTLLIRSGSNRPAAHHQLSLKSESAPEPNQTFDWFIFSSGVCFQPVGSKLKPLVS